MDTSDFNTSLHTHTAIEALKIAYEECSDKTAKNRLLPPSRRSSSCIFISGRNTTATDAKATAMIPVNIARRYRHAGNILN